jgi:hypothetical protein
MTFRTFMDHRACFRFIFGKPLHPTALLMLHATIIFSNLVSFFAISDNAQTRARRNGDGAYWATARNLVTAGHSVGSQLLTLASGLTVSFDNKVPANCTGLFAQQKAERSLLAPTTPRSCCKAPLRMWWERSALRWNLTLELQIARFSICNAPAKVPRHVHPFQRTDWSLVCFYFNMFFCCIYYFVSCLCRSSCSCEIAAEFIVQLNRKEGLYVPFPKLKSVSHSEHEKI